MGIQALDSRRQVFAEILNKKPLPYLHGVFLLAVWLFSRSDAILAISFIPDLPLLKREQGRTLSIWIEQVKASRKGAAVYEQEIKRNRDKKCSRRLEKYINKNKSSNSRSLTRQVFVIFLILLFCSLYKTNRFHFVVCLFVAGLALIVEV